MDRGSCIYVNTSIVIRALNPGEPGHVEARGFLEECCSKCRCIYSSVHGYEMPPQEFEEIARYLRSLGAQFESVDVEAIEEQAVTLVHERGLSRKRIPDIMHMLAARLVGCRYLLARDRFMWRHAYYFGLVYVNWETHRGRCPCPRRSHSTNGQARTSENGERDSATSYSSHTRQAKKRKQETSSKTIRKANSHTARRRRSSRNSPAKPKQKPRDNTARHRGHRPSKRKLSISCG